MISDETLIKENFKVKLKSYTTSNTLKILLLEDDKDDVFLIEHELGKTLIKYSLRVVVTQEQFIKELHEFTPDIILSDHLFPEFTSLDALRIIKDLEKDIPFILVTGSLPESLALEILKAGAEDYLLKDNLVRLPVSITKVMAKKHIEHEKRNVEKLNAQLEKAFIEIAEKNKDITDSISYARKIQEAMLPDLQLLKKHFPESFVMFRPKDIVSGDFYWFYEKNNLLFVAVVDCTGHGVPGAFMSILGYNFLNEAVITENLNDPGEILSRVNKNIQKLLKQDQPYVTCKDGMDIALCVIDKQNQTIEFAGANRPLFFFSDEFISVKGNKFTVGGPHHEEKIFITTSLSYKNNDTLYLFSDGYIDQFGGKRDKKMLTRNFLKLLKYIKPLSSPEQHIILEQWLEHWKGNILQTDDILLIGIKF